MTRPKLNVKEFIDGGYLQEVNRQFFHPLGLALAVEVDCADGIISDAESFRSQMKVSILDSREDPEGFIFGPDMIDRNKAMKIREEFLIMMRSRIASLRFAVQPIPPEVVSDADECQ